MHAVVINVTLHDPATAARTLESQVVARVAQPPGDFVTFDSVEVAEVVASA